MDIFEQVAEMRAEETAHAKDLRFVENLLKETDFPVEKIASLVNVSIVFVMEAKNKLFSQ